MRIKSSVPQKHKCISVFDHRSSFNDQMKKYWLGNLKKCHQSRSENLCWKLLKNHGYVRQFFMGRRFFDFFNIQNGVCVEIDGPEHCSTCDLIKDQHFLDVFGIQTLRFKSSAPPTSVLSSVKHLTPLVAYDLTQVLQSSYELLLICKKTKEKKGKKRKQREINPQKRASQEKKKKSHNKVILRKKKNSFLEEEEQMSKDSERHLSNNLS